MDAPRLVCIITLNRLKAVQIVYVWNVSVVDAARRQFSTLYGYGARRMRKSSFGRRSIARTMRLIVTVQESQWEMKSRRNVRERMNTVSAPLRAAQYDIMAPVQGPNV